MNLHACDDTADLFGNVSKYFPNSKATETKSGFALILDCSANVSISGVLGASSGTRISDADTSGTTTTFSMLTGRGRFSPVFALRNVKRSERLYG